MKLTILMVIIRLWPLYSQIFYSLDYIPTKHEPVMYEMIPFHSHLPSFFCPGIHLFTEIPASVSEVLTFQSLYLALLLYKDILKW